MTVLPALNPLLYESLVRRAIEEDLGRAGDLTTEAVVAPGSRASARIVAREFGRVAGLGAGLLSFQLLDPDARVETVKADGSDVDAGDIVAVIDAATAAILTGERVALNILGRACGIATATREAVALTESSNAAIGCTRKTPPGLRAIDKYAVRVGGGRNHRFGLDDAVMIKDNHIAAAGGLSPAIRNVRAHVGHMVKIAVEVDTLEQLDQLIEIGADSVLLDNMTPDVVAECVRRVDQRMITEASGGIKRQDIKAFAETGVDVISLGWLTHSAAALDVSLELKAP